MVEGERRVVVVHDYATQRGGAERVALDLLRAFPGSRLVTSCWDRGGTYPDFADFDVQTLWVDRLGLLRSDPRRAFPFLSAAFSRHIVSDADVVVCSSSGWAHRVGSTAPKIVYCHNPARWLYQPRDYFDGVPAAVRDRFVASTRGLRRSDTRHAQDAARYVVNSEAVGARVRAAYDLDPTIVAPARGLDPNGRRQPIPGIEPGYLLTVSRPRNYKHTDVVCDAVSAFPGQRLVVVGGAPTQSWPLDVTGLNDLNDDQMRWLYANARGLVAVAFEDFGLTPAEAQSFGLPSVVLRSGGYLDSSVEGVTAVFVDEPTVARVAAGIRELLARDWDPAEIRQRGERFAPSRFAREMNDIVDDVLERNEASPPGRRRLRVVRPRPRLDPTPAEHRSA